MTRKITILALGSRGDVQPLLALGLRLKAHGYQVCVATHGLFEGLVRSLGLEFFFVQVNPREALDSQAGQAALAYGLNPLRSYLHFTNMVKQVMMQAGADCLRACQSTEAVLFSTMASYFAPHIGEKFSIPIIAAPLQPLHPTRAFPSWFSPVQWNLGGAFNRFTYFLTYQITWLPYRSIVNQWRVEYLSLPPISIRKNYSRKLLKQKGLVIYGISPTILPKPADWGDNIEITGYWFLNRPADWQPPCDLVDFLSDGPPPVYFGFGSVSGFKVERVMSKVLEAISITRCRAILATGWGGLSQSDLPAHVYKVEFIPHDWLFPHLAAAVHHGGAGTTAASLRAGIPTIIVPFYLDMPFWGRRVADLGVGPEPVQGRKLSAEHLAAVITHVLRNEEMRKRAAMVGSRIRNEDGLTRAVEAIDRYLS
ncbi:MAG: glycosyltransferase [bacterium]